MDNEINNEINVNTLYEMFSHLVKMLNKYAIRYACSGGTLLGSIRHGGLISWDDDVDITIEKEDIPLMLHLKTIFEGLDYQLVKVGKYMKLKKDDLFIDIFIIEKGVFPQQHYQKYNFNEDEYYPLQESMFGDIQVKIPHKSIEYLNRTFPRWQDEAFIYNHKSKGKQKMTLTMDMRLPYLPNQNEVEPDIFAPTVEPTDAI